MKKIYYEKVGRKYIPVYEYDSELLDALPKGHHLISVMPGIKSTKCNIDPNYAAVIAASRIAEDAMSRIISDASEMRRNKRKEVPLTLEQKQAWEHLVEVLGDDARYLEYESARGVAEAGVKAMEEEAMKLMQHEAVRNAYEHFQLVCKLTAESNE